MVQQTVLITPYNTALPFITTALPKWVDDYDSQRLASYDLYDDLYENSTATTSLILRGSDDKPIYIPSAKRLINTMARYVGRGFGFSVDGTTGTGDAARNACKEAFGTLFARERILSKFTSGKREWLRRGDWIWLLVADPGKPEGSRISIKTVDPRMYFPIFDIDDPDRMTGVQLVEETIRDNDVIALKVQRWLKPNHPEYPDTAVDGEIAYDLTVWDIATWAEIDPDRRKILEVVQPLKPLPGITSLPVYHLRNNEESGNPYGKSELSGLESVVFGLNQAASDEDLALAMAGLGMYETDSGTPEGGVWELGPQQVVEHAAGTTFGRVTGVASVQPSQQHISYLEEQLYGTVGLNHVALGAADASVTESGVALALKMQPLFDAADEKDLVVKDVFDQMFHDLLQWFEVYEGLDFTDIRVFTSISQGDRLPFDRTGEFQELLSLFQANVITLQYFVDQLNEKFGYEIPAADVQKAIDQAATAAAQADPYGSRVAQELGVNSGGAIPATGGPGGTAPVA